MFYFQEEDVQLLECDIYFPMLLKIFKKDYAAIENSHVKLKGPYLLIIRAALNAVQLEYNDKKKRMRAKQLSAEKQQSTGQFTSYVFRSGDRQEVRKYSNIRLRNHVEELLNYYYAKVALTSVG